jgi:hypothetical protein
MLAASHKSRCFNINIWNQKAEKLKNKERQWAEFPLLKWLPLKFSAITRVTLAIITDRLIPQYGEAGVQYELSSLNSLSAKLDLKRSGFLQHAYSLY